MGLLEGVYKDCRIPIEFWEGFVGVFFIGMALLSLINSGKKFLRFSSLLLLIEYCVLIYCCTIVFRPLHKIEVHMMPLWSYYSIYLGKAGFIHDILLNIFVFTPIGFLLGIFLKKKLWLHSIIFASFFSVCIEISQLLFQKGVAETDDVIHNTIGCILGLLFVKIIFFIIHRFIKA